MKASFRSEWPCSFLCEVPLYDLGQGSGAQAVSATGTTDIAIAAIAVLWMAIGVVLSVHGARRFRLAQQVIGAAQGNARLLENMPCRPLLVRADGSIEIDQALLRDLGLPADISRIEALAQEGAHFFR